MRHVVIPFLVARSALVAATAMLLAFFGREDGYRTNSAFPVDVFIRWDSRYYLDIADRGYGAGSDAFFPVYPVLTRLAALVLPLPYAAVLVANVGCVAALELLRRLVLAQAGAATANRSVWIALIFPTSFFLSAAYAESTYLALLLAVFVAAQKRRYAFAALAVWLACLARPQGFFMTTLPFGVTWLLASRERRAFPWFTLAAFGALAQLLVLHAIASGDPLSFLHADGVRSLRVFWGDHVAASPSMVDVLVAEGFGPNLVRRLLNFSALALITAACVVEARRRRWELALTCALAVALPLYFQRTIFDAASMARYALFAFPVYALLARLPSGRNGRRFVELAFPLAQLVLFAAFAEGIWAE